MSSLKQQPSGTLRKCPRRIVRTRRVANTSETTTHTDLASIPSNSEGSAHNPDVISSDSDNDTRFEGGNSGQSFSEMKRKAQVSSDHHNDDENVNVPKPVVNQRKGSPKKKVTNADHGNKKQVSRLAAAGSAAESVRVQNNNESIPDSSVDTNEPDWSEWVCRPTHVTEISSRFQNFLMNYTEDEKDIYRERLKSIYTNNYTHLSVDVSHLQEMDHILPYILVHAPMQVLQIFSEAATSLVFNMFPSRKRLGEKILIIINKGLPKLQIADIKSQNVNKLVRFVAVIVSISSVMPKISIVKYQCKNCANIIGPYVLNEASTTLEDPCQKCQSPGSFHLVAEIPIYDQYQRITVQENSGSCSSGCSPQKLTCILTQDLCDKCKPGEEFDFVGVLIQVPDTSFDRNQAYLEFEKVVLINFFEAVPYEKSCESFTHEDISQIINLSKDKRIAERIKSSIMPSYPGYTSLKRVLALALFGGVRNEADNAEDLVRGDINIILYGNSQLSKTEILEYVKDVAPKCVFTVGKDVLAEGLTSNIKLGCSENEWTLEAGALALANNGFCLIDGIDDISDKNLNTMVKCMGDLQVVTINEHNVVNTLKARCSVLASVNHSAGVYNPALGFYESTKLSMKIASHFDILCFLGDDGQKAVARTAQRKRTSSEEEMPSFGFPNNQDDVYIPQAILKKYILFARTKVHPKIQEQAELYLTDFYKKVKEAAEMANATPVTACYLESLFRLAQAHARMHLREEVNIGDAQEAAVIKLDFFVHSQKRTVQMAMKKVSFPEFGFKQ